MNKENQHFSKEELELWFSSVQEEELKKYNSEKGFKLFQRRVSEAKIEKTRLRFSRLSNTVFKYAAVILLMVGVSTLTYQYSQKHLQDNLNDLTINVPRGAQTDMLLPDGTKVILNGGSKLTYSARFGLDKREVEFEGEAYFEVKHDENKPFVVKTKELLINVLGTKFNMKNYPTDEKASVSLFEGKVSLVNKLKGNVLLILAPNEKAVLNKKSKTLSKEAMHSTADKDWTDGMLRFDDVPLYVFCKDP
jgi:Fe2+-dicitrate sensor, membrane component